jgi:outer membrane receptor for Fe3+-dicitrate
LRAAGAGCRDERGGPAGPANEIIVTGYRASLQRSAELKKNNIGLTETILAEDIGKFPDSNIAESLSRVPGVTISRDNDGEGVNAAIRGLGSASRR